MSRGQRASASHSFRMARRSWNSDLRFLSVANRPPQNDQIKLSMMTPTTRGTKGYDCILHALVNNPEAAEQRV